MSGFGLVLAVVGGGLINNQSSILLVWSMLLFGIVFGAGVGYLAMSIPKYGKYVYKLERVFFPWCVVRSYFSFFTE
jgi:hypothetical protein